MGATKTMRTELMVAVSLFAVALAGCTDPPPSGEVSGSSVAVPADGNADVDTQGFEAGVPDPSEGENPAYDPCPFAGQAEGEEVDPFEEFRCQRPFTKIDVHMMSLPDPQSSTYEVFITDSKDEATEMKLDDLAANGTGENLMYEMSYDNTDDCADATEDAGCDHSTTHDTIEIRLGEILVATAALGGGSFEANEAFSGTSFVFDYEGDSGVLTLSGAGGNITYEAVLYEATGEGETTAVETYPVSEGENEIQAENDIADYAEVHIHVEGTKINVAQGTV